MSVYQSHADRAPDDDFEPGALAHLVPGNTGRLLDPRRTPVTVVAVTPGLGAFTVRIDDFEDAGATWEATLDEVRHYQFARGQPRVDDAGVRDLEAAWARFDRPLSIPCDPAATAATRAKLADLGDEAGAWLRKGSSFLAAGGTLPDPETRIGDPRLCRDLRAYMALDDLAEIEDAFAEQFVRNPCSGELVKGHRIVIAELGLVPFEGRVVRDPHLFDGAWSRPRREQHVLRRLAFVSALFASLGLDRIRLYRGLSTETPLEAAGNRTFVSATFSHAVARSHFDAGSADATRVLYHQPVPVERVFMTYLETEQMNRHYKEAEAVLFLDPDTHAF